LEISLLLWRPQTDFPSIFFAFIVSAFKLGICRQFGVNGFIELIMASVRRERGENFVDGAVLVTFYFLGGSFAL